MQEEKDIWSNLRKAEKPAVPPGFFESVHASVKAEIDAAETLERLPIVKRAKPARPAGFDSRFMEGLENRIGTKPRQKSRIIPITWWAAAAGVAAVLAVLFLADPQGEPIITGDATIAAREEALDTYVAYLDEEEMVDYILENDIRLEDEDNDAVYDIVHDDLEDIYMDF